MKKFAKIYIAILLILAIAATIFVVTKYGPEALLSPWFIAGAFALIAELAVYFGLFVLVRAWWVRRQK